MLNFAEQCLDMAGSILEHNLDAINEDGSITPVEGESQRWDEPGHAALAIGEYFRATGETTLGGRDLVDLAARCITAQAFTEEGGENGLGYAALGLLSFGPAKDRNPVWERLVDVTREQLDNLLLARTEYVDHKQAFNIAKAVTRFSMGLSKKDETGKLVDGYVSHVENYSSAGFCDDGHDKGIGGVFDIYGMMGIVFIRQSLQLHSNMHLRDRKLPSLRPIGEKYLKLLPDVVRQDGMGWVYGRGIGAYGQMHLISLILQSLRDGWIPENKRPQYQDILRRLFQYFFMTYLDQEHGFLVIRDEERDTYSQHTTRMANLDGARYLSQWARLAKSVAGNLRPEPAQAKTTGRWVIYDKSARKEQGLYIYQDANSGLHVQLPLVGAGLQNDSNSLAFPHCPGVFDWPTQRYLPVLLPELTFGDKVTTPSYYAKNIRTGLGLKNSFYFQYQQPELITLDEKIIPGVGTVEIRWDFSGNKAHARFTYRVKNPVQLDKFRYCLVIAAPHSKHRIGSTYTLGAEGLRCNVIRDDFQGVWQDTESVTADPNYRSYYGNIHYVQTLLRDHPLNMRPGQQYQFEVSFEPDIVFAEE